MIKFFSNYRIIFYSLNIFLITLYLFPGSLVGWFIFGNKKIQPQITPDFIISSNHFYVFILISAIGFLSFKNQNQFKNLIVYLVSLSLILEIFHLFIPERSFQLSDLFGNFLGVIVVIFVRSLINKHGVSKNKFYILIFFLLTGCSSIPVNTANSCSIFDERYLWFKHTKKVEQKWGTPIYIQLAIIKMESDFDWLAKPPEKKILK